ncbi:TIGR00180 family glycosyltransferase [Candidatus Hydrogenedentota bacterium]
MTTIVIPTYNRPQYLRRTLRYYEAMGCPYPIVVGDSSADESLDTNRETISSLQTSLSIEHLEFKSTTEFFEKLALIFERLDGDYALMCADDDFVTPTGIGECVTFLDAHPDFSVAHGYAAVVGVKPESSCPSRPCAHAHQYVQRTVDRETGAARLMDHLANYSTTFYSVHRLKDIARNWRISFENTTDLRFGELLPSCLSVIQGKVKCLDILYMVRQTNPDSTSKKGFTWFDLITSGSYSGRYTPFRDRLAEQLVECSEISIEEACETANQAFTAYLGRVMPQIVKKYSDEWGIVPITGFQNDTDHLQKASGPLGKIKQSLMRILEVAEYELTEKRLVDVVRLPYDAYDRVKHEYLQREAQKDPMAFDNLISSKSHYHKDFLPILDSISRFPNGIEI